MSDRFDSDDYGLAAALFILAYWTMYVNLFGVPKLNERPSEK